MQLPSEIQRYVFALRRRWWLAVLPVVLLTPVVVTTAFLLPSVYESRALVLVEQPQIPPSLARSTVTVSVEERIALIEQRLTSRENLLSIAERYDVVPQSGDQSPTALVRHMNEAVDIRGVRLPGSTSVTAIEIVYRDNNPARAAEVANEFLTQLLERNIQQRTSRAFDTSRYFRDEVDRLARDLNRITREVSLFKIANAEALPDSLNFRRQELSSLEDRLFERQLRRLRLEEEKRALEEALQRGDAAMAAPETPEMQELKRLQTTLVQQRTVYAESHPVIRSLQTRIASLERSVTQDGASENSDAPAGLTPRERGERALERLETQLALFNEQQAEDETRIAELTESIARTPDVELELNELLQEQARLELQYGDATLKLTQAETGERLEVNRQAERFETIEQPVTPTGPQSPNRRLIVAAGVILSSGLGVGLVILLELFDRTLRTADDMQRMLDLRPVATIPYIAVDAEIARRKWAMRAIALFGVVLAPAALWAVDQHYLPLPLIGERIMERTGLQALADLIAARLS